MNYLRRHFSGICVCGHDSDDHHGNMVMNLEYYKATGESMVAGECEFYGFNECTDSHCPQYWDKDNPEPDPYATRRPKPDPSIKVGGCPD